MFLHIHRAWWYNWQSSWRGAVCISLCVSPFHISSSHPGQILLQHLSAFLPASSLLHFGSLFCRAFVHRLGTAGKRYRAVQRIQSGWSTPACMGSMLQCSIWLFFTRKNIYFGRGKKKTENKLTLTNPKTKYRLRNPLVPSWVISYLKEWIHNTIVLILTFEYLQWDLSQVELRREKKEQLGGQRFCLKMYNKLYLSTEEQEKQFIGFSRALEYQDILMKNGCISGKVLSKKLS